MKKWKIWAAFISVFAAGAIFGVVGFGLTLKMHMKPPRDHAEFRNKVRTHLMERIIDEVEPNPEAIPAISAILDQTMVELDAFKKENHPKLKGIFTSGRKRIKEQLTAEQQQRFDSLVDDMRNRRFNFFRPPPPPPPF